MGEAVDTDVDGFPPNEGERPSARLLRLEGLGAWLNWKLAISAIGLLFVHMWLLSSSAPVQRNLRVHLADWPADRPPMRVALLSDLHVAAPSDSPAHLARVVQEINAQHPDLVLIAGDFLSTVSLITRRYTEAAALAPLAALRAPFGSVAVLGNHDTENPSALTQMIERTGVTVVSNAVVRRGPLVILGIYNRSYKSVLSTTAKAEQVGGVPIVMMHSPDSVPLLPHGLNIVVAGHTHCGQIAPLVIGPIETSSFYGRRYLCGMIHEGPRIILVTGGIGTSQLPLRLGAEPDYWMIELGR